MPPEGLDLSILFGFRTVFEQQVNTFVNKKQQQGFPGGAVVESPPANAGDTGSSPGLGGSHMPRSD